MSAAEFLAEVERITAAELASLLGLEARHRVSSVVLTLEAESSETDSPITLMTMHFGTGGRP